MNAASRQLALDWPHTPSYAREDFLLAPENQDALNRLEAWPDWPSPMLLLLGPKGSGKSHLVAIWARLAAAERLNGRDLAAAPIAEIGAGAALAIDDADQVGAGETSFFHLLNLARENGASLLMSAARPPDLWGLTTPDLLSRLRLAPSVSLGEPNLDLIRSVLFKLFSDRQIVVDAATVNFIALRLERSLDAARAFVAALDHAALERGAKVSRHLAADLIREYGQH